MLYYLPVFMSLYVSRFGKGFQSDQRRFAMLVSIVFHLVHHAKDVTVTSQVSDYYYSSWKRREETKDYSVLFS